MLVCKKCKKEFNVRVMIDGKQRILNKRKFCLECSPFGRHNTRNLELPYREKKDKQHSWQKKERIIRKQTLIDYRGGRCIICGYNRYIGSLDFHHLDPDAKVFGLSTRIMTNKSIEKLKLEADKTVVLCRNCHGEVHAGLCKIPAFEEIVATDCGSDSTSVHPV